MYRLLEKFRPARKNNRRSARASANEAAQKWEDRPRQPVKGAVDITTAHNLLGGQWPAQGHKTPLRQRVAFCASEQCQSPNRAITLVPPFNSRHLQGCLSPCTIEIAYQAADANHPNWGEKARRW